MLCAFVRSHSSMLRKTQVVFGASALLGHDFACLCECDSSAVPVANKKSKKGLGLFDLPTECRLRQVQSACSPCKVQFFGERNDRLDVTRLKRRTHTHSCGESEAMFGDARLFAAPRCFGWLSILEPLYS